MTKLIKCWNYGMLIVYSPIWDIELEHFITIRNIDVMLISVIQFTKDSYFQIPNYTIYDIKHPRGKAHDGTAVIIHNNIEHYEVEKYQDEHI